VSAGVFSQGSANGGEPQALARNGVPRTAARLFQQCVQPGLVASKKTAISSCINQIMFPFCVQANPKSFFTLPNMLTSKNRNPTNKQISVNIRDDRI
jgi:hypothetical protein